MHDNFAMDTTRHSDRYSSKKSFVKFSRRGFFILLAIILCSLVAVAFLVYNLSPCLQEKSHMSDHYHLHNDEPANPTHSLTTQSPENKFAKDLRLPRSIKPLAYDVVLLPYMNADNFTFNGEIKIKFQVVENCKNVTLHSLSLRIIWDQSHIQKIDVNGKTAENLSIHNQYFVEEKQFLVLETNKELEANSFYLLRLKFLGTIKDNLQGFYKSSYKVGSQTRWIASTQFQATDARRAFPCMDEPHLKAKFRITLGRPKNMKTLSNMPLEKTIVSDIRLKRVDGYVWDVYEESVPMSTYLVAFVICDFVTKSDGDNFAVWTRKDAIRSMDYSLEVGPQVLRFLEDFFGIKYPLPKTDMIAIPDFAFGAMGKFLTENWGLITFRETAMLYEQGVSAIGKKMTVAAVISHEIAHQWFGNLVTPSWWSDLWLNEGFATYMEHICVDHIEPSWKSKDLFVVNELHQVFALDALTSSHKISVEVSNPDQINEIFDSISYSKGASIIRSMENFLTTAVFKQGLSNYLIKFSYQSASQDDLWDALTDEARKSNVFDEKMSVKEIMDGWTLQTGFPYIQVTRNYENDKINFVQRRFVLMETNSSDTTNEFEDKDPLWWVPITFTTKRESNFSNTLPSHWMKAERNLAIDHQINNNDWLIVNLKVTGYYRVNYDATNWKLITHHLNDPQRYHEIAQSNRAQLIDDAMNLARADLLDYTIALDVTKYLSHERDHVPWKTAINNLMYIDSMLLRTSDYGKMKKYFVAKIENTYNQLGFDDSGDVLTVLNRFEILKAACHLGVKDCVSNSIRQFHSWIHEGNPDINNPVSPNLKSIVYCTAIKHGDSYEWDFAWDRYLNTTISSEKEILLQALGCSREHWLLSRYLERAITENGQIRKQDVFRVFSSVSSNVWGQSIAFNFIIEKWSRLRTYFEGSSLSTLNSLVKFSTKRLTDRTQLDALKNFNDSELQEGRTIKQAVERAEANIAWLEKNYAKIISWLENNSE